MYVENESIIIKDKSKIIQHLLIKQTLITHPCVEGG